MKQKLLWLDVETGGLSPRKHGLLQVAFLVEIDGKIVDKFESYIKPPKEMFIDDEALKINGITKCQIRDFPEEHHVFRHLLKFLGKHVDKYDKTDKFIPCGYNCRFDTEFLQALWERNSDKFYASFINYYDVDTFAIVKVLWSMGIIKKEPNLKLGTVYEQVMGKPFDNAHDAIADIKATRKLHNKIVKKYLK